MWFIIILFFVVAIGSGAGFNEDDDNFDPDEMP